MYNRSIWDHNGALLTFETLGETRYFIDKTGTNCLLLFFFFLCLFPALFVLYKNCQYLQPDGIGIEI